MASSSISSSSATTTTTTTSVGTNYYDICSLMMVGLIWGCTNPLVRRGGADAGESAPATGHKNDSSSSSSTGVVAKFVGRIQRVQVLIPYLLNQSGSLVFYYLLSTSDLSLAVPICNGLALVFSALTSHVLGERVDKPIRAIVGISLVVCGVCICVYNCDIEMGTTKNNHNANDEL